MLATARSKRSTGLSNGDRLTKDTRRKSG